VLFLDATAINFRDWLTSLGAVEYFAQFIEAGYDLDFIKKYGLKEEDLDCVGIPTTKLGLRRKFIALYRLEDFYSNDEDEHEDELEEDEDAEDEGDVEEEQEEEDVEGDEEYDDASAEGEEDESLDDEID
jgi:hypothetical protein